MPRQLRFSKATFDSPCFCCNYHNNMIYKGDDLTTIAVDRIDRYFHKKCGIDFYPKYAKIRDDKKNKQEIIPPKRFTGLHAHTSFSTFDGLGYPSDHIDFITSEQQGMDSWALTDHGNGSGLAHAYAHANKIQKLGKKYRQLYGVEFYFVPSLKTWQEQYDAHRRTIQDQKDAKKSQKLAGQKVLIDAEKEVEQGGLIVENEDETRSTGKGKPNWKRYYHLVVIAKNSVGLGNLFTLVKKSYKYGFYRFPRIDFNLLREHSDGLVVSTACVGGLASGIIYNHFPDMKFSDLTPDLVDDPAVYSSVMSKLQNMTDYFVDSVGIDNFFLELQFNSLSAQHLTNKCLIDLSEKTGIPIIATADSHFPSPNKWEARELYKKLGWMGSKLDEQLLPKKEDMKTMLYPKNAIQMWDGFKESHEQYDFYKGHEEKVKEGIERTHDIAWQMCEDTWIDKSAKLPKFGTKEKSAYDMLEEIVHKALVKEGMSSKKKYVDRVKSELSDIKFLGHEAYFLAMYKIFDRAKDRTLFGPGRGSGSGSLVNFLLGITQINPLKHSLLWSRFLGRHRVSWPDIDTDAGDRDALIDSAKELFGDDAVIPVSNFNTLKLKSLIKDISKFYGVPFNDINKLTNTLQEEVMPFARDENEEKSVFVLKHEDCMKHSQKYKDFMIKYPEVEKHVETLFMENRSIGRHAGGVIIAPADELEKSMPIVSVRGELQTPWTEGMNFRNLEDNGFLKFDFLGLTLLKDVENCIGRILKNQGNDNPSFLDIRDYFDKNLNCRYNDQDDLKVWKHSYHNGRLTAVFQFTADGARRFCLDAKPTDIETLAALTAIYRPGPLKANVHKKFVNAKNNADKIKYDHHVIEKVLGPTFNFVVFQEQFMLLAQELSGFTPEESDRLRKTLVKKSLDTLGKKGSEREAARKKFVKGAKDKHGISEKITQDLWETIEAFSVYGFNKSHAIAYAIDSYYAAWLHTYYEKEWLATILQSENNNPRGLEKTISEIRSYGYKFDKSDINYSGNVWEYNDEIDAFVPPLSSVKGVGKIAMNEIIEKRPFSCIKEFLYDDNGKWRFSKVNKTALKSLCMVGAFGSIKEIKESKIKNHRQLYLAFTQEKNHDMLRKGEYGMTKAQIKNLERSGKNPSILIDHLIDEYQMESDWSRAQKIENYMNLTSTVSNELMFPSFITRIMDAKYIKSIFSITPGFKGKGWFCITNIIEKKTKNGKIFYRLKIIDNKNNIGWLRVWGRFNEKYYPDLYTICIADVHNDKDWGMSTSSYKIKQIRHYEFD